MYIVDRFLWNTIGEVIPEATEEIKKEIYDILHERGRWRIDTIEAMYAERVRK